MKRSNGLFPVGKQGLVSLPARKRFKVYQLTWWNVHSAGSWSSGPELMACWTENSSEEGS